MSELRIHVVDYDPAEVEVRGKSDDGKYRLRILYDAHPERPYDEGASPILQYTAAPWFDSKRAHQYDDMGHWVVPDDVIHALNFCRSDEVFERYMRIFHGTTKVVWKDINHNNLVTFDTAAMREALGWGETAEPGFEEYEAWANGEVYGYVIEELVTWGRLDDEGKFGNPDAMGAEQTVQTWEYVDACFGFYGFDYACEAGEEAFNDYRGENK